ncbi:MAG: serine protease [Acidobacteriota bacterium]|nr:MAG: serine protease [Acidobacteriota bacterium]
MRSTRLGFVRLLTAVFGLFVTLVPAILGQHGPEQIVEKAAPAVALLLIGKSPTELDGIASAMVARENGVLLTAYHVLKGAKALQVRFKNGEVFDNVSLLGVDSRRDIAAIRISASGLQALPIASASQAKPGESVFLISHAAALPWTVSSGSLSAYRLADEVPGAGSGYRLFQFTARASPGSSGGVLIDSEGRALGLVVGALEGGQNLNFAVPVESVIGLAEAPEALAFDSGAQLELSLSQPAVQEPVAMILEKPRPAAPREGEETASDDFERSEVLKSKDKSFILANFRTLWVDTKDAQFFGAQQMQAALGRDKNFLTLGVTIVDTPSIADVVLEIGYTFAWDYPFSLKHVNSGIVLVSGKGSGPFSGAAGAASVARELTKLLKPYRTKKQPPS